MAPMIDLRKDGTKRNVWKMCYSLAYYMDEYILTETKIIYFIWKQAFYFNLKYSIIKWYLT